MLKKARRRSILYNLTRPELLTAHNLQQMIDSKFSSAHDIEQKNIWNRILQLMPIGYTIPDMSIVQPLMNKRIN